MRGTQQQSDFAVDWNELDSSGESDVWKYLQLLKKTVATRLRAPVILSCYDEMHLTLFKNQTKETTK